MMLKKLKTVRNMSPVAKAALAYTFAGLATRGLSIITVPIFTRIMSTAEIGNGQCVQLLVCYAKCGIYLITYFWWLYGGHEGLQ